MTFTELIKKVEEKGDVIIPNFKVILFFSTSGETCLYFTDIRNSDVNNSFVCYPSQYNSYSKLEPFKNLINKFRKDKIDEFLK